MYVVFVQSYLRGTVKEDIALSTLLNPYKERCNLGDRIEAFQDSGLSDIDTPA